VHGADARGSWQLNLTDTLVLGALAAFAVLALAARQQVAGWGMVVIANLGVAVVYAAAVAAARRLRQPAWRSGLRAASVCAAVAYLFSAVAPLQLVLRGRWLDGDVLALEQWLSGVQPTVWLQRLVSPWLTEWMMFAYVAYVALYPLVCVAIWRSDGEPALEHCLLGLTAVNVACDVGFVVFPVAGPMAYMRDAYTVPLFGGVFTAIGELIRSNLHYVGGSLPSPHCAAATVLWAMTWRYRRRLALALAPIVLTLYVATVYCRYHYVSDGVAGVLVAVAVLILLRGHLPLARGRVARSAPPSDRDAFYAPP
jgi:membrane-associated phospholipid phosphatase